MMKPVLTLIFSVLILQSMSAQNLNKEKNYPTDSSKFDIVAGFGIKAFYASDIVNYINSFQPDEKESGISTAPEFYFGPEYQISETMSIKLEYLYLLKSYNKNVSYYSTLSFNYSIQSPSIIIYYLIKGEGYYFKFGGGLGYSMGDFTEKTNFTNEASFHSSGPEFKIDFSGHTTLGGNLYAVIGANLQAGFLGDIKIQSGTKESSISLGFIGGGIGFGLAYYF